MSCDEDFEARARGLLAEGLTHVDSRVRSRLTQARHEAVAAAAAHTAGRFAWLRSSFGIAPAAGAMAAVLAVAVVLWVVRPVQTGIRTDASVTAFEDVSLLTDNDGLEMVEDADSSFYEWAAGQT